MARCKNAVQGSKKELFCVGSLGDPSFLCFLALGLICVRIVFLSILRALLGGLEGSPGVLFIEIT